MATARPFADMLAQFLTIYLPVTCGVPILRHCG
jgi:hypothetical protein